MYRRERGCLEGGGGGCIRGGEEKGSCQTGAADLMQRGNIRKARAHFPFRKKKQKNKGFAAAPVNKEPRRSIRAQALQDVLDRSHA